MSTSIRRRLRSMVMGILGLTLAMGTSAGLLVAAADAAEVECNLNTLIGQYLTAANGSLFPPAFGVTKQSVSAVAGYSLYNGDGTGSDHIKFTVNGVVEPVPASQPFTYTLNPDCTGTRTVLFGGPTFAIFVAPNGDALTEAATSPQGFAVAAFTQRVEQFGNTQ